MTHGVHISKVIAERKASQLEKCGHRSVMHYWKELARRFDDDGVKMLAEHNRLEALKEGALKAAMEEDLINRGGRGR